MRYQRLDLNLLVALRVLLKERSVTRSAEQLHVTQSAMSGMLSRLREHFDDQLILQVGRRMELTPLGEALVDQINELMVRLDATLAKRAEFDPATSRRHFSVVGSDYVAIVLLLGVLQEVHQEAPGLRIEFKPPSNTAGIDLENGEVDFVINPARFTTPRQSSVELFQDDYRLVVDQSNANVGDSVDLEQFRTLRHATVENNGRPQFESWFLEEHGSLPSAEVVVNTFSLLPRLVIGTSRVVILHTRMAVEAARQWPVRLARLDFAYPRLVQTLQWHRFRELDPGNEWLRNKIIAHADRLPPVEELG